MGDAPAEVGVNLCFEKPTNTDGFRINVVDVERNHRFSCGDGGSNALRFDPFVCRDDFHRLGHNAHTGRLQLRHIFPPQVLP